MIKNTIINSAQDDLLEVKKMEFCNILDKATKNFIEIGKRLNSFEVEFGDNIKTNMLQLANQKGFSYSNLHKYMQVAREFTGEHEEALAVKLGIKKAYALLSIEDKSKRLTFIENEVIKNVNGVEVILSFDKMISALNKDALSSEETLLDNEIKLLTRLQRNISKDIKEIDLMTSIKNTNDSNYERRISLKRKLEELRLSVEECNKALKDYTSNLSNNEDNKEEADNNYYKEIELTEEGYLKGI